MSAHRHAWKQRAGVIAALVASALLALPAPPAQAAPPAVQITSLSSGTLTSGQKATLKFRVANKNLKLPPENKDSVTITVSSTFGELTCEGQCDFTDEIDRDASKEYTVTLVAGNVAAGASKSGQVQVTAKIGAEQGQAGRDVTVRGPQPQAQTVKEVSGKVVDSAGQPVANAVVMLLDSQQHAYSMNTNNVGNYRFTGSTQAPITPGSIELGASKDGSRKTRTISASAGQTVTNQRITLELAAEPTATPSAEPTEEPTEEEPTPSAEATEEGAADTPTAASDEDSGGFGSWLLIIVGGLFVAVGVGTIVLLWMRRKEQGDDEDGPAGTGGTVPPTRGGYRGADDQTRIVNRPGGGPDPTMAGGPSLADAPTMMHSRPLVDDEFPDKYGAPLPSQQPPASNYGGAEAGGWAGSGYGNAPASGSGYGDAAPTQAGYGYGNAPASGAGYGNAPASGSGYGSASGADYGNAPASGSGYGNRDYGATSGAAAGGYPPARSGGYGERYDEPTGRYDGGTEQYTPPADPYATGAYSPPAESGRGYGQDQPYGRGQEQTGGYSQGGGYGGTPATPGGYDAGQGYGNESGYGQRDYGSPGGYDQPATGGGYDQRGGYDRTPEQHGGYDNRYEQGGYYGAPPQQGEPGQQPPQQQDRPGRRSLDWMDD